MHPVASKADWLNWFDQSPRPERVGPAATETGICEEAVPVSKTPSALQSSPVNCPL